MSGKNNHIRNLNESIVYRLRILKKGYYRFLPRFSIAAVITFVIDIIIFSLIRQLIGSNPAAFISFLLSHLFLFIILRISLISKIKDKKKILYDPMLICQHHYTVNGNTWKGID